MDASTLWGQNNLYVSDLHWFSTRQQNDQPSNTLTADSLTHSRISSQYSFSSTQTNNGFNNVYLSNISTATGGSAAVCLYPGHLLNYKLILFEKKNECTIPLILVNR